MIIDVTTPNTVYLWQDNSTNSTFNIIHQGKYWVQLSNSCGISTDTINVNFDPLPEVNLGNDTTLCRDETLVLRTEAINATYLWQDNSSDPTFNVIQEGVYWVEVSINDCASIDTINVIDCQCRLYIPNSFTPNLDDINDQFSPISECDFDEYNFIIFNRWGEKIFEINDSNDSWNGTYHERLCHIGVYVYLLRYKYESNYTQKYGTVTLLK